MLRHHTNLRYYMSRTPYARMGGRLVTYVQKQIVARRMTSGRQILDELFKDVQGI